MNDDMPRKWTPTSRRGLTSTVIVAALDVGVMKICQLLSQSAPTELQKRYT
jgi:hypothetical protein